MSPERLPYNTNIAFTNNGFLGERFIREPDYGKAEGSPVAQESR